AFAGGHGTGAGEAIAAEGRAGVAGPEPAPGPPADDAGAHRHARAQAFRQRHHIGKEAGVLVDEPFSSSPQPALHLVRDEQPVAALADLLEAAQVIEARDVDAAFALDRLDHHRRDVAVVLGEGEHGVQVVERHAHETRNQRLEAGLYFAASR